MEKPESAKNTAPSKHKTSKAKAFNACLTLIAEEGWSNFSFSKAASTSGIPLHVFHENFSSPADVMVQLFRKIDKEVLKTIDFSEDLTPKDALFDILMARFDAAHPYKPVIKSFWESWILTPKDIPPIISQGFSSMLWVLDAAHLKSHGLKELLRLQGLSTLYLLTLRVWLKDDSPDMGKTMAFLDNGLSHLEKFASVLNAF